MNEPLLSIAMIAYNVEPYIGEAIESVISQQANFSWELVIGEDCSTDNTLNIIKQYQQKHPDKIRILEREKNLGLTPNSIDTQNNCRGKYIALLDGDDFWTDTNKLQLQIDFLESHAEYSASAHQSTIIKGSLDNPVKKFGAENDTDYVLNDTITHRKFHTSSLVYKRELWVKSGGIPATISSNERAIYPMLAIYGPIRYFGRDMCVYRIAPTGLNSRITSKELATDLAMIPWLKDLDKRFPANKFRSFLHLCIYSYPRRVAIIQLCKHFFLFIFFSFSYFPKNLGDIKYGTIEFFRKIRFSQS